MLKRIINLVSSLIVHGSPRKIFLIGTSHCSSMRPNYSNVKDLNDEIDYVKVEAKLINWIKLSREYLINSINKSGLTI